MNKISEKVWAVLIALAILIGLFTWIHNASTNIYKTEVIQEEKTISIIDSVWYTSPGQENTLQTDYRYYGKALNGQVIVSTDKAFHIGDSIVCVYHRYEKVKTKKKQ